MKTTKKKVVAMAVSMALAMAFMTTSAFADDDPFGTVPENDPAGNESFVSTNPSIDVNIPVFGYVGEDADLSDPANPRYYDISVSVPTRLMWAAFESEEGKIVAPNYQIVNRSTQHDVAVELTSFEADGPDNAYVDSMLVLNLTGELAFTGVVDNGTYKAANKDMGVLESLGTWVFSLDGTWNGDFDKAYTPKYKMVLTFSMEPDQP
ncbi:MAG: hypothetical protein FWD72_01360 [Eggerthellaceae bacterium]|nr:hypothetical protein [Eggerthellaceae bacterium]